MRETDSASLPKLPPGRSTNFPIVPVKDIPAAPLSVDMDTFRPVVLVVDDESAIADSLASILNLSGYAAMAAYDGDTALETALLVPPELLITDVILPGMNGVDLAIAVRRTFPDCKIILFSGQAATADLLVSANRAGHHFVLLTKPVHRADLLARVSESFKSRLRHQSLAGSP
jgi:DNA-binding response OmpR family regulator